MHSQSLPPPPPLQKTSSAPLSLYTLLRLSVSLLLLFRIDVIESVEPSQCIAPLGMENKMINDKDITASSSFDHGNVGPHHGRIRNEINGGAWCPQTQATPDTNEWIEIDLHTVHMITATETQGRFGNGQGVEFAESYMLEYYRPNLSKWIRYRTRSNIELLQGNINTYLEYKTILDPPIWASKIRFLPYSSHKRTVCMRVEIYGCRWTDGIVSYSMPQGDKKGVSWELYDFTYDGHWDGDKLKNGLGQLTDGQVAPDDFKQQFHQENSYGWIGWKNYSRDNKPIEIVFEFDRVREFTAVHLFTNNQIKSEVEVFSKAKVYFSVGGKRYKGEPIVYDYIEDKMLYSARNVSIKLHHRVGRFVKLQLFFAAKWIMISEVTFESSPVLGNFTIEEEEEANVQSDQIPTPGGIDNKNVISAVNNTNGQFLGIIIGVLAVLVIFMIITVLYIVHQQRKYKSSPRPNQLPDKTALYRTPSLGRLTTSTDYADPKDPEYDVPLQAPSQTRSRSPPNIQSLFPKPPSESYYAASDIVKPHLQFSPPPPPLNTPPVGRQQYQQHHFVNARTYVGP